MAKAKKPEFNAQDWHMSVNYDSRFGVIGFGVNQVGRTDGPRFLLPLRDLLDKIKVPPHELRAILLDEYKDTEGGPDIDGARVRLLESVDWKGKTCLDLAGYDGFAARIAIANGATSAKVVDSEQWRIYGWAQPAPIEGVEFIKRDLYEWKEPSDIVVWYNCLYHLPDPMRALNYIRTITKERMLLCTLFKYNDGPWMYVYEPRECNPTDPSVYFGPSLGALERMLSLTGWKAERYALAMDRVLYVCEPIPDFVDAETAEVRRVSKSAG